MLLRSPRSTLFPYTTLFRSESEAGQRPLNERRHCKSFLIPPLHLQGRGPGEAWWRGLAESEAPLHRAPRGPPPPESRERIRDRKSTRLNSSHSQISYAVFCL